MTIFAEKFNAAGCDYSALSERTFGDEALIMQLMQMFLDDDSFFTMQSCLEKGETENAFRAAHSLKGSCGMLGLDPLFEKMVRITDELRHGELEKAKMLFPQTRDDYERTIALIRALI